MYKDFIRESNKIEGIHREPTPEEIAEFERFIELDKITIKDLEQFVSVYAPGNVLRDKKGLNVRIGGIRVFDGEKFILHGGIEMPKGGKEIRLRLQNILDHLDNHKPYVGHVNYELLHPFTDGNGRSGRALWAWQMHRQTEDMHWLKRGFLHTFYYQALNYARS